jgi:hypothetical protein
MAGTYHVALALPSGKITPASARAPPETPTGGPASGTAPSHEPEKPFAVKLRSDSIPMILRDKWKMVFLKVMPVAVRAVQIDIFTALSRLIV